MLATFTMLAETSGGFFGMLDSFLTFCFVYGIPVIIGLATLAQAGIIVWVFLSKEFRPGQKIDHIGHCVVLLCCSYVFFHLLQTDGDTANGVAIYCGVMILIYGFAWFLRSIHIPFFVPAIIYLGIAIYGL